jgi:phage FluMu protein gp41
MVQAAGHRGDVFGAAVLAASLVLSGCASIDRSVALTQEIVTPITVGEAAAISAHDLAEAMLRAGFSREQILRDGPAVRNALATSGGAQLRSGKMVEALFAVHGDRLYVTSRTRGTFVQPLRGLSRTDSG